MNTFYIYFKKKGEISPEPSIISGLYRSPHIRVETDMTWEDFYYIVPLIVDKVKEKKELTQLTPKELDEISIRLNDFAETKAEVKNYVEEVKQETVTDDYPY